MDMVRRGSDWAEKSAKSRTMFHMVTDQSMRLARGQTETLSIDSETARSSPESPRTGHSLPAAVG